MRFGLPADQDAPDQDLLILDGLKFLGLFGLLVPAAASGFWCVMVFIRSATEFQTPALRVVRVVFGLRRGMTPDPDSWRAVLIDAARSLNEERSFFSSVCRLDRRGGGEGEGEDEGEHDREVTGLGRACCRRPNDCLCICGPKLLGAVAQVVTGVLVGVCSCFIRAVTGGWVKGTEQR